MAVISTHLLYSRQRSSSSGRQEESPVLNRTSLFPSVLSIQRG